MKATYHIPIPGQHKPLKTKVLGNLPDLVRGLLKRRVEKELEQAMKDHVKFFLGLAIVGVVLLVLGHSAAANSEIKNFDGKGALFAAYAAVFLGLVLLAGGGAGLAYVIKKILDQKIFEPLKNRLKF
ncbi:MAG TPA: hypothetical protein VNL73_11050 [Verrucomicrobiae bacterium]|nr:hypothetical protein [Verrucomicrobiae bacterium]